MENKLLAEELVQDTFAAALAARSGFFVESSVQRADVMENDSFDTKQNHAFLMREFAE